jgi:hypothetical protein
VVPVPSHPATGRRRAVAEPGIPLGAVLTGFRF